VTTDLDASGSALAALHARAEAQAERFFGDGAAPVWRPPRRWSTMLRASRRPVLLGTLLLAATTAVGIAFLASIDSDEAAPPPVAIAAPRPRTAAPVVQSEPAGSPDPAAVPILLHIGHEQGLWRIEAQGADRLAAARQLAALNGTPLRGAVDLLAGTRPLTVSWQGRDASFAWRAVLADEVNFALQCRAGRCQAWILSAAPEHPRSDADAPADSAPGNRSPEEQDDPSNAGAQFH